MANALVANPDERGAFAYNHAAMAFHEGSSIALGAALINPNFSVTTDRRHEGVGTDWISAPMIQGMAEVNGRWRFGLGVHAPFGLETHWEEGTFPRLTGSQASLLVPVGPGVAVPVEVPKGDHPTLSRLEIASLTPSVVYRASDGLSLAAGLDYYRARETRLDSSLQQLAGDGDGWGWNLSFLYAQGPWSVGAAFHSGATLKIEGTVTLIDDVVALGRFGRLAPVVVPAEVDLHLPWRFQIGARYEVTDTLAAELDWSRTGWSRFGTLKIRRAADGSILGTNTNLFDDSNAYRIGLSYDVLPQTRLRLGYAYDETGQGDGRFSPRIADSDRHLISVGAAQDLGQGWTAEAGYMYVMFNDRDFSSSRPYRLGEEINGTAAVNGEYQAHAHLVGLELRKTF
jgi:long-chain fatty acid transport protein